MTPQEKATKLYTDVHVGLRDKLKTYAVEKQVPESS